jgi:hypothetical protein
MGIEHQDDASLYRWGRNLGTVSPAVEELAKAARVQEEQLTAVTKAVSQLSVQGESSQPADRAVVSQVQAVQARLAAVAANPVSAELAAIATEAEGLRALYMRRHDGDEGRLSGERGGRHVEKRADVQSGEQDT